MAKAAPIVLSHWSHLIEDLEASPLDFYERVEAAIERRELPDAELSRVEYREKGLFSAKREYLRAERKPHVLDICGAPFGTGFFVSWWLGELRGCLGFFYGFPFVGPVLEAIKKPRTYYEIDTARMFQASVHRAVLEVVDQLTEAQGLRTLSEAERKPTMDKLLED